MDLNLRARNAKQGKDRRFDDFQTRASPPPGLAFSELAKTNQIGYDIVDFQGRLTQTIIYVISLSIKSRRSGDLKPDELGLLTCDCAGIRPGGVEPASPRHGDVLWVGSTPRSPVPTSLHLLVLQLKPSLSGL